MKITEIFEDEQFNSLNTLVRWNGVMRIKDETVAHHLFLAGMFGSFLLEELFRYAPQTVEMLKWRMEIGEDIKFHDFDEMFGGDVLYPLKYNKYNGADVRRHIDEFVTLSAQEKFSKGETVDRVMTKRLVEPMTTVNKKIVKVADWLACVFYLNNEVNLGNKSLQGYRLKSLESLKIACETAISAIHASTQPLDIEILHEIMGYVNEQTQK